MTPEQLGPYRIGRQLGRGGMGAVYEGLNVDTDEPAAIKILSATLAHEPDFRQRFEAEIETLRKLYHPNIVQLFGFGEQDEYLFYAMELVDGNSLEEELRRGRCFDWREVARIGIETCRALRHAHDRGIIHRDIKPANLLLSKDNRVKLSDFGIAQLFGNTRLTAAGSVLGTAEYMAPEQADARPVGPRSDLYSLGGVLYCLVARRPPFRARSLPEMLDKHRSAQPDPPSRYASETPAELDHIILQLLEKDPEKRVVNATLVSRRLEAMLRALSVQPSTQERQAVDQLIEQGEGEPTDPATDSRAARQTDALPAAVPSAAPDAPGKPSRVPDGRTATLMGRESEKSSAMTVPQTPGAPRDAAVVPLDVRPAHVLPETKATDAFQGFAVGESVVQISQPQRAAPERNASSGRFVTVREEDLDRLEEDSPKTAIISLHTVILATALVAVGMTVWYFLRPPPANDLYARIMATAHDNTIESLLEVENTINEFLRYYPQDDRAAQLRGFVREIELHRLELSFSRRARSMTRIEELLPIERAFLESINYESIDPEQGAARLKALVEMYQDRKDLSGPAGRCLELARRRYERLSQALEIVSADTLAELEERLEHANDIRAANPAGARAIWRGLVELYQEKEWAAEVVAAARAELAADEKKSHDAAALKPKH